MAPEIKPITVTSALLASRVRLIGPCVCLVCLCSCITMPGWFAETSQRPILPAEASFTKVNGAAGRGGNLFLTLRFESGEELLFLVDTGTPFTVLDKSLDRKLGRRVGTAEVFYAYYERRVHRGVHKAPKLFLGTTQLQTSKWVVVDDLSQMRGGLPVRGILGMDCLRHYCFQLNFADGKMRFLDPDNPGSEDLGKAFPITFSRLTGKVIVHENFVGVKCVDSIIDTGDWSDGALHSELFQKWTNRCATTGGSFPLEASAPNGVFGGETYPDLMLKPHWQNFIGLRFLARHLVTFNFPRGTMFLQRQTVGPLMEENSSNKLP